ncbi:histone-like nucleoid-structuring protein Lsr2 [Streptomyces sp. NPDC090303]|uniref:Lsr2 family DNA-binding protein n=1 Tax=Streptomyces sp. NPDC090303 TaxID=3365960 RepID=UPI00381FAD93
MSEEAVDLEDVAAWLLRQTWLPVPYTEDDERWQRREFFPALISLYKTERPRELRREAEEAARQEERARIAAQSREAARIADEHRRLMLDIRAWGPENGFFVGTRGPIPRQVIEAYNKEKGIS